MTQGQLAQMSLLRQGLVSWRELLAEVEQEVERLDHQLTHLKEVCDHRLPDGSSTLNLDRFCPLCFRYILPGRFP